MATTEVCMNHLSNLPLYDAEKPYEIWFKDSELPQGIPRTNVEFDMTPNVALHDVRDENETAPTLDVNGVQYFRHEYPTECGIISAADIGDSPKQRVSMSKFIDSIQAALLEEFDGIKAVCYDWRVRKARSGSLVASPNFFVADVPDTVELRELKIGAAHQTHADGSPDGIKRMLAHLLSEEEQADVIAHGWRLRIVNVWRPIVDVVYDNALAVCDTTTVIDSDWEVVDKVQKTWVDESMYLKHSPRHKWYWKSRQTRHDALVFTVWDSLRPDSKSASTAHCAVMLPDVPLNAPMRESVELRFILWTRD